MIERLSRRLALKKFGRGIIAGGAVAALVTAAKTHDAEAVICSPRGLCSPGACSLGCGCCVFLNGNSRCLSPDHCVLQGGVIVV